MSNTVESFTAHRFTTPVPTEPITAGVLHRVPVPSGLRTRFLWLAAGAFYQRHVLDMWYVLGKLTFRRRGTPVCIFEFSDASAYLTSAVRDTAPRAIVRIKPDGTGSAQPSFQWREEVTAHATVRDNCDCPCFQMDLDCDEVEYEIEKTRWDSASAYDLSLLTGLKILSL